MNNIAILITTFLRDDLLFKTVCSVMECMPVDVPIIIGDQNPSEEKRNRYCRYENVIYIPLPYDCGLSYARNILVAQASQIGCDYVVISADSIQFRGSYDFNKSIRFMKYNEADRVGFKLNNRVKWEFDLTLVPGKYFRLDLPTEPPIEECLCVDGEGPYLYYQRVDICKNFFIAKIQSLIDVPWDEELKLMEHEDWSWRYKQAGYKTYVTDYIAANYIDFKPPEYLAMRNRMYSEFRKKLMDKWHISEWIAYGPGVMESIKKDKNETRTETSN